MRACRAVSRWSSPTPCSHTALHFGVGQMASQSSTLQTDLGGDVHFSFCSLVPPIPFDTHCDFLRPTSTSLVSPTGSSSSSHRQVFRPTFNTARAAARKTSSSLGRWSSLLCACLRGPEKSCQAVSDSLPRRFQVTLGLMSVHSSLRSCHL